MNRETSAFLAESRFNSQVEAAIYAAQIFAGAVLTEAMLLYTSNRGDKNENMGILYWESYVDDVSRGRCSRASAIALRRLLGEHPDLFKQGFILVGEPKSNTESGGTDFNGIPWNFHTEAIVEDSSGTWWAFSPANSKLGKDIFFQTVRGKNLPNLIQNLHVQVGGSWMPEADIKKAREKYKRLHFTHTLNQHQVVCYQYLGGKPRAWTYSPDDKHTNQVESLAAVLAPETRKHLVERCIQSLEVPEPFFLPNVE